MDEITVAALWAGCENYVKNHPAEFSEGAEVTDSKAYWAAVNEKFQRVVERTQPNYTTMQRTGMQRTTNEMAKFLMMFSTQRQQNEQNDAEPGQNAFFLHKSHASFGGSIWPRCRWAKKKPTALAANTT